MPIYEVFIDGKPRKIELTRRGENSFTAKMDGKTLGIELQSRKIEREKRFSIVIDGEEYRIELPEVDRGGLFPVKVEEATFKAEVKIPARRPASMIFEHTYERPTERTKAPKQVVEGAVAAPMTGRILSVRVNRGDRVEAGQVLCILEAMKMENEITAPKAGTVRETYVYEGSSVSEGEVLFVID